MINKTGVNLYITPFIYPCRDLAFFDSFSTGHDTPNCLINVSIVK